MGEKELEKERNYKYTCLKKEMAQLKITEVDVDSSGRSWFKGERTLVMSTF